MKTTFKKVFDEFDDEIMNIDENSVCENMDIDVEKIKGEVFMRLEDKENKKRTSKKVIIMLVAAVIIAVGTIGAYASGSLQYAFQDWFSGDLNSSGLYDGGKVELKSCDESLNVNLLGITGDDEKIYTSIEVTKKDGSAVIDEDYSCPYWTLRSPESIPEGANWNHYYTCRASSTDKNGNPAHASNMVKYSLSNDNKVLKIYIYTLVYVGDNLVDGRMTVTSESLGAYKINEVLDKIELGNPVEYDWDKIKKRQKELGISDEDCINVLDDGYNKYCYGNSSVFELPFEMSFDLNYRSDNSIEKSLSWEDAPDFIEPIAENVEMRITPFGIYLFGNYDVDALNSAEWNNEEHNMDFNCFKDVGWDDTSKIILNDGTVYYLYPYEGGYQKDMVEEDSDYDEKFPLNYSTVIGAPWDPEFNVVDTREIKTVMINGNVVYSK